MVCCKNRGSNARDLNHVSPHWFPISSGMTLLAIMYIPYSAVVDYSIKFDNIWVSELSCHGNLLQYFCPAAAIWLGGIGLFDGDVDSGANWTAADIGIFLPNCSLLRLIHTPAIPRQPRQIE